MASDNDRSGVLASRAWQVMVVVVCLLVGVLLSTTRQFSSGDEIRRTDTTRLSTLVRSAQDSADQAESTRDELAVQVEQLQREAGAGDSDVADALAGVGPLLAPAGLEAESGPGVVVTLTDAPRGSDGRYASDASPDDLVVHQQDVQSVLNALWSGGATALAMQDQRVAGNVAPRCIGNTLLLGGRTYSPPYIVTALGDAAALNAALDAEPGVQLFRQYSVRYGLGLTVGASDDLTVPAYQGSLRLQFAQPG
ncbi:MULTISPECIES: DUF881 domain-containing protein [Nocardiaceae]|jgi:uncharacterized protein YlxW (UPF0749 family)|uniref:DUF881 domain-containing protein n=1 Tax=Nocardiaceae TaxID=85025 RepID=UPI0005616A21|nr:MULTISPECIES: DUF881 domain-containing protein [Rhodococcus]OZF03662.1 DUF881 domain-containing protein [Rhodococcus sp. 15-1189-1-1a]OZF17467.1 DUF881 domain-containing protein [Rhodococcus sp. 14-2686-1-2]